MKLLETSVYHITLKRDINPLCKNYYILANSMEEAIEIANFYKEDNNKYIHTPRDEWKVTEICRDFSVKYKATKTITVEL